jgi:hypothetical protein
MQAPMRWRHRFLMGTWTLLALPVLLLWRLLCAVLCLGLSVGIPLVAAGLWVVYALPALLVWSISPAHHPLLYLGIILTGAIPSGAVVCGCVHALLAVAVGGGRQACAAREA